MGSIMSNTRDGMNEEKYQKRQILIDKHPRLKKNYREE